MKILAIGAHPDDIEFGVGGLIIKEAEKGSEILYAIGSLGEAGTSGTPEERRQEAEDAAKIVGAKVEFLDLGGDCHMTDSPANAIKIAEVIRRFKPEVVLAPSQTENQHPDHKVISDLARVACRLARYGGLTEVKHLPVHKINGLYFYPSGAEWDKRPDIIIDMSGVYEKWEQAMSAHKSQMKTREYLNLVGSKAAALGASVGVKYAIGLWTNDPIRLNNLSDITLSSRNY